MDPLIEVTTLDPDGDLRLNIGDPDPALEPAPEDARRGFLVSKKHLTTASDVFRAMINGQFSESGKKVVELPDDSVYAAGIILAIIHSRFASIPKQAISPMQLTLVARFADKYNLIHVLTPFLARWTMTFSRDILDDKLLGVAPLFSCWIFGRNNDFRLLSEALIVRGTNMDLLCGGPSPPDIVDNIQNTRKKTMKKLRSICQTWLNHAIESDTSMTCRSYFSQELCTASSLGALIQYLKRNSMWPLPDSKKLLEETTVNKFAEVLRNTPGTASDGLWHLECGPRNAISTAIDKMLQNIACPVEQYHIDHLAAEAAKLALL